MADAAKRISDGSFKNTIRMTLTTGGQLGIGYINPKWHIHSAGMIQATSINPEGTALNVGIKGLKVGLSTFNGDVQTLLGQVTSDGTNFGFIQVTSGGNGTGRPIGLNPYTLSIQPGGGNTYISLGGGTTEIGTIASQLNVRATTTHYQDFGVIAGKRAIFQDAIINMQYSTNECNFLNTNAPGNTHYYINYRGGGDYKAYRWQRGFANGAHADSYAGTHVNVSDFRLKDDIKYLNNDVEILSNILKLKPAEFNWKHDPNDPQQPGFIAQDVESIFPLLIHTSNTLKDGHGFEDEKAMNYSGLTPYLVSAIKALNSKNVDLENRIARLELLLTKNNIQ